LKKRVRNRLSEFLSSEELTYIYDSYDVIGDIAIIRVTERSRKYSRTIARTIMNVQKNVETVLAQASSVRGDFQLRKLEFVAGEYKTTTVHKESGCLFSVDVEKCSRARAKLGRSTRLMLIPQHFDSCSKTSGLTGFTQE